MLECLTTASIYSLVKYLWAKPGAYPKVEFISCASLRQAPALPTNIILGWKRLATDKHSSLLRKFVNYGHKKFHNIGPSYMSFMEHEIYFYLERVTRTESVNCDILSHQKGQKEIMTHLATLAQEIFEISATSALSKHCFSPRKT